MGIIRWLLKKTLSKRYYLSRDNSEAIKKSKEAISMNSFSISTLNSHILQLYKDTAELKGRVDTLPKPRATAITGTKNGSSAKVIIGIKKKAEIIQRIMEELKLGTSVSVIKREILPQVPKRSFYRYLAYVRSARSET